MAAVGRTGSGRPGAGVRTLAQSLLRREAAVDRVLAVVGLAAFVLGTLPALQRPHGTAFTALCLIISALFAVQYALRLVSAPHPHAWAITAPAIIDLLAAAAVPAALLFGVAAEEARLFGVLWSLKLIRLNPAFALLARVLRNERQPLVSVMLAFVVIMLFAATLAFLAERKGQPDEFSSIPASLWWTIVTITTTGYGDKAPLSLAGRILAGGIMISGIGLFALWAGILAAGFAQELRRRDFLQSFELVARLPLFRSLGAAAISEIARLLKVQHCSAGTMVIREGQAGDSMYFIAEGEVEVRTKSGPVRLGAGQFFGEMALVTGAPRNASIVASAPTRLLRLDVVEFLALAGRQPELLGIIEAESRRRAEAGTAT